jgi:two-component system nitrate/nitrite response regulator NarL
MKESTPRPSNRICVLVAESSLLASQLISTALKRCGNKFHVHALAGESGDALRAVREYHPDVALISAELQNGPMAGLNVLNEMRASHMKAVSVMLISANEGELILRAFRAGARGVFCRGTPLKALSKCIRKVHEGQVWANTDQMQLLLEFIVNLEPRLIPKKGGMTLLTPREQEVACLVAEGMSNQDIANQLKLSEHTVRNYLFHIFDKLGLSSRVELTLYALSQPEIARENDAS